MKTEQWLVGCIVVVVLVACVGGAIGILVLVPAVEAQLPPGISTMVVTLSMPVNDSRVPLNQFTAITAQAVGVNPITALELWIDGTPAETKNPPGGASVNPFAASWSWTPASEGEHTLLVRALDMTGNVGLSNVVRVTASKDANVAAPGAYEAKTGDTVASVAQAAQVSPQQIIDLNPQISPSGTITPGQTITIPVPPPPTDTPTPEPPPQPPPDPGASDPPGNPNKYIIGGLFLVSQFSSAVAPAKPDLSAGTGAGKCSIDLYITDNSGNETGFYLYRLDNNAPNFKWIATLDAHSGPKPIHYVDPVASGKYQYYVAAFNAAGMAASKIVKTAIIEPCGEPQGLGLANGTLTIKQPVDKIYCYLSIDNGPWTRIPPGITTFLTPTKPGEFDVSQYLKSLTPSPPPAKMTLHLECWGWNGGTLVYLGEATETVTKGAVQLVGTNFVLMGELSDIQALASKIPNPNIAHPTNVKSSLDPQECIKRAPSAQFAKQMFVALCMASAGKGYQFLTWDWSPQGCPSGKCIADIDGYNVYIQYIGNEPARIETISYGNPMIAILPPKTAPTFPPWLFVRAFKDSSESEDSNLALSQQAKTKLILPAAALEVK